jgi:nucleotide-binding universal stress UspA family protein
MAEAMNTTIAKAKTLRETLISSSTPVQYKKILVPHDGSTMADNALEHAIYLSNISTAEIIILNVLEHLDNVESSAVMVTSREENEVKKGDYKITLEGELKNIIEEKIRLCKQAGLKGQVSYKIQTGKAVEEIIKVSEEMNIDLLVMASSESSSLVSRILGSTVRRVIDNVKNPVLIVGPKRFNNTDNAEEKGFDSNKQYKASEPMSSAKIKAHEPTAAKEIMDLDRKESSKSP